MKKLGISPFMKLFRGQDVIAACVKGGQYNLLEYLVKDTNYQNKDNWEIDVEKYRFMNDEDKKKFIKSKTTKDECGNNSCHYAFEIKDVSIRYKFLELLIKEAVGDISKPNILG